MVLKCHLGRESTCSFESTQGMAVIGHFRESSSQAGVLVTEAGAPARLKNLEIQPLSMLFDHLAFATSTIQAPSQDCFPEAGGAVAFNGITPMFFALRWKRFSM